MLLALRGLFVRQPYFPVCAGHWLLTIDGLVIVLSEACNLTTDVWRGDRPVRHYLEYAGWTMMVADFLMFVAYVCGALAIRDSRSWRIVILCLGLVPGYWAVIYSIWTLFDRELGDKLSQVGMICQEPLIWTTVASIWILAGLDVYRRRSRDWLHWTGVIGVTARIWLS